MTARAGCQTCGAQPREGARFCDSCGAALATVDVAPEYKQVTIVFADVVGSMAIASAVGPERLSEIMGAVFDLCSTVVKRYGGTVDKFTGDGIMALFGAPKALEDHAYRACLAALDIQREIGTHSAQLRIGLNSGGVIAGEIGSAGVGYTAIGEAVGMAQRMESVAPPGGVMLSETTARLVADRATLAPPEMVAIKGSVSPVAARRLLSSADELGRPQHQPRLVGRTWELNALGAMVDETISGYGCIVEVVGPPGIGKSRLIHETRVIAAQRDIEVFTAYCESHRSEIPFSAAMGLLRSVFGVHDLDDATARTAIRETLAEADDTDIRLLEDLLGIRGDGGGDLDIAPDARRRRLAGLLNTAALARTQPAMLVVEDVHWIDPSSEAMLADFASIVPQTRILMLVSYRPEYQGLLSRKSGSQKISLVPLNAAHSSVLLDALIGSDTSTAVLKARIAQRAEGNPFFAQEMVRDLVERGALIGSPGTLVCDRDTTEIGVPATLQSAIAARIDRLDHRAKRTVNAAAVVGARFDPELLHKLLDDIDIAGGVNAELLEQVSFAPRAEYAFRHPMIRTVAYESQLRSQRSELHRRAAAAIEADEPDDVERNAALIAEHLEAAGDLVNAFSWHMRAGDWFSSRDIEAARLSWRRACALADGSAPETGGRTAMRIAARQPLTGSAWRVGAAAAETGYEELRSLAIESGDRVALAVAMFGKTAQLGLHEHLDAACRLGAELVELVKSIDDVDVVLAALTITMYPNYQMGRMDVVLSLAQRIIDITNGDVTKGNRFTGSPLTMGTVLRGIARASMGLPGWRDDFSVLVTLGSRDPTSLAVSGTYKFVFGIPAGVLVADAAAVQETAQILETAERFGEDFTLSSAQLSHGIALAYQGGADGDRGLAMLALTCEASARDRFLTAAVPTADIQRARYRLRAGDVDGSLELARSTADAVFKSGNGILRPQATTVLVEALLCRSGDGDLAAAHDAVERLAAVSSGYTFQELPLLRQRALLARAKGDELGYRELRGRYRATAADLGFEGHLAIAEAMN